MKWRDAVGHAALFSATLTACLALNQRRMLFNPLAAQALARNRPVSAAARELFLRTEDGERLHGWWLDAGKERESAGPLPAVLYLGGRAEQVAWIMDAAPHLFPGASVLALNYRGYGCSSGLCGEPEMQADAALAWRWLASRPEVDVSRIAVVGRSLGCALAVRLAARQSLAGLVLISPYDSVAALLKERVRPWPLHWLLRHRFETQPDAARLRLPVLVVRAERDPIVPARNTERFCRGLRVPFSSCVVRGSGHHDLPAHAQTARAVAAFLQEQLTD